MTVTDRRAEVCPLPVHWKVKVEVCVRASVNPLPESVPALDQLPLGAVQDVALDEPHVSVARPP